MRSQKITGRLMDVFKGVTLIAFTAYGDASLAQDYDTDISAANDNQTVQTQTPGISQDTSSLSGDDADALPAYLRFKPLDICREAEASTPDELKARALDDDRFVAVHEWADTADASQILTYRLCREENPGTMGDAPLIDVLERIDNKPWITDVLVPFFETDPAFYLKALSFFISPDGLDMSRVYLESSVDDNDEGDDRIRIVHTPELLLAVAGDPSRAERMLYRDTYYNHVENYEDIVRAAFAADPLMILKFGSWARELEITLPDNMGELLLELAGHTDHADTIMRRYELYAHLDEAYDIIKKAFNTAPAKYFDRLAFSILPRAVIDDPSLFPSAESLLAVSSRAGDLSAVDAYNFLRRYRYYAHLPEAPEIFNNLINAVPRLYIKLIDVERIDREDFGGDLPRPDPQNMLAAADNDDTAAIKFIEHRDAYADWPHADEILRKSVERVPLAYFKHLSWEQINAEDREAYITPSAEALRRYADSRSDVTELMEYYDYYSHLAEGREILETAIETHPVEYLRLIGTESLLYDPDLFPDAAMLSAAIDDPAYDTDDSEALLLHYDTYAHIPDSREIAKKVVEKNPFIYLNLRRDLRLPSLRRYGRLSEVLANDPEFFPSAASLLNAAEDDIEATISLSEDYAHLPEAEEILTAAIRQNPRHALRALIRAVGSGLPDSGESDNSFNLKILETIYHEAPEELANEVKETLTSMYAYITLARHNPDMMEFVLEHAQDNASAVMYFLSDPKRSERIAQLEQTVQDLLVDVAKSLLSGECKYSFSFLNIMRPGSWLAEHGNLSDDQRAYVVGCAFIVDKIRALDLLEENPEFGADSDLIRNVVMEWPLYFLRDVTRNEETDDFRLHDITVSYDELMQGARAQLSENDSADFGRRNTGDAIEVVNSLHNYNAQTRFALLRDLTPEQRVILAAQDDSIYYTSSYNHIFDDALEAIRSDQQARAMLFEEPDEDDRYYTPVLLRITMNAMHFGKVDDFLAGMNEEEVESIASALFDRLEQRSGMSDDIAVIAATVLPVLEYMNASGYGENVENSLIETYKTARKDSVRNVLGALATVFAERQEVSEANRPFFEAASRHFSKPLENYMRDALLTEDLFDDQNRNFQMMVLYDDEDGHNTFGHFKTIYGADGRWSYRDHGQYISYARSGITLYANKPWHEGSGNRAIENHVEEQGGDISVLVHRGHSYHVRKTADQYLNEDVAFFWLGSCRSSDIWSYIDEAPDMQFIYSQNIGTMLVNDPLLKNINDTLAIGRNVYWPQMRDDASRLSGGDKRVKDYVFPDGSIEYGLRMTVALLEEDRSLSDTAANDILEAINLMQPAVTKLEQDRPHVHLQTQQVARTNSLQL